MSKKKSLGHNPLAHRKRKYASFDFIAPSNDEVEQANKAKAKEDKVNKTTTSYYLEEPVINKIKTLADQRDTSYSALVNEILKQTLRDLYSG